MRAGWHAEFGPADEGLQIGELDRPEPGEGEVLVPVCASGINPLDVKKRAGARGALEVDRANPPL